MADPGRIPGPLIIPNCVQVRLAWSLPNGKTVYNVFHARVAGGFTATSTVAENVFAALKAAAGWTSWKARVSATVSLTGLDLRDQRSANLALAASTGAAAAGTGASGAIPPRNALVVTLRTANAGVGFRGRAYLPGLDFSALAAGGVAAAGTMTDATAFVTALQTAMTGQGLTMAIAQPARAAYVGRKGRSIPARAATTVDVSSITCRNNAIDSQRRRQKG